MPFTRLADGQFAVTGDGCMLVIDGEATITAMPGTLIDQKKPTKSPDHPTMKPPQLIERMLMNSARAGDIVLDPFGGSGSTLIAAERLNMRARLVEIDPRYCDVIVGRWEKLTGCKASKLD